MIQLLLIVAFIISVSCFVISNDVMRAGEFTLVQRLALSTTLALLTGGVLVFTLAINPEVLA